MSKIWFITGCSSGFGRILSEELIKLGEKVIATARNIDSIRDLKESNLENVEIYSLDVTNKSQIKKVVEDVLLKYKKIDVLVNNAGYGICGALEEASNEEIRKIFDTNVFGLIDVTKAILPSMRKNNSGHILNLSSIAGLVSTPGFGIYNATKFAVEGLTEALAGEVASFNIKVTLIEPGPFRTDFAGRSITMCKEMKEYDQAMLVTRNYIERVNGNQPGDPVKAVKLMIKIVNEKNPPLRLLLGKMAHERFGNKYTQLIEELTKYREQSLKTDF